MNAFLTRLLRLGLLLIFGIAIFALAPAVAQNAETLTGTTDRSIQIRQITGNVSVGGKPAKVGEQLREGEKIITDSNSSATLVVEDGIATLQLSESTQMQVQNLDTTTNNGKVTRVFASRGQVTAFTRKLINPESRFEIAFRGDDEETEGGIAGSRGTVYGVAVGPNGKTGISTKEGEVAVTAEEKTVLLGAGTSSLVFPGKPPTLPRTTSENILLKVKLLSPSANQKVRVQAEVDPLNLVFLNGQAVEIGSDGKFDTVIALSNNRSLSIVVRTPLGQQQVYELEAAGVNQP
ncbi:hypothetical protein NG798_15555 [Ancylothrix sp. C2]|uniref:FecR family protein n=1 Tax=Ancylothrix sp. D3o TaxID=2953691 RepID=UPI0021BA3E28|nr:hypothetical protein [Ancylothrix sp. D3o]MCT7951215.1 hypothetical protein [Ancylothrix sp. D3o]